MPAFAKRFIAPLLVCSMVACPPVALGAEVAREAASPAPECHDIALGQGGVLAGKVVDASGRPVADGPVWLGSPNREPIAARTDASGRFAFQNLPRGVFYLQAGEELQVCRVWEAKAAPPKAQAGLLIVADSDAVRGQMNPPPLLSKFVQGTKRFFTRPIGVLTIGAAIATPIALAADDDDPPASP